MLQTNRADGAFRARISFPTGKSQDSSWGNENGDSFHKERGFKVQQQDEKPRSRGSSFQEAEVTQSFQVNSSGVETPTECRAKEARVSASDEHDSERKFAHRLRATWGEAPSWSPTMRDYLQRLEKCYDFVRFHQLEITQIFHYSLFNLSTNFKDYYSLIRKNFSNFN